MKRNTFFILVLMFLVVLSCKKEAKDSEPEPESSNEFIQIISLTAEPSTVKAWDTTHITVVANGENLQYEWEADHGVIDGNDSVIIYWAGECCIGLNTITCKVSNDESSVSDTVKVNVTSYFD